MSYILNEINIAKVATEIKELCFKYKLTREEMKIMFELMIRNIDQANDTDKLHNLMTMLGVGIDG